MKREARRGQHVAIANRVSSHQRGVHGHWVEELLRRTLRADPRERPTAAALVEFSKRAPRDADALGVAFEPLPPYIACDSFGLRGELLARIGLWS